MIISNLYDIIYINKNMTQENIIYFALIIYSIILHEIAHGFVAKLAGDKTAEREGRITLNPIPHIDPIGSILIPLIATMSGWGVFGYAKGVPINLYNLNTKFKQFAVAVAGVATNLLIGSLILIAIKFNLVSPGLEEVFFKVSIVNFGLAFFNLIPIPPFDGMRIVQSFFPAIGQRFQAYENNPLFMIVAIIVAMNIFGLFYKDIMNFVLNIFF
jgi:Zn-dependent protease